MRRFKTRAIRAAVIPFMAVGGVGAGQVFTSAHPGAMPYAAAVGCIVSLTLCYLMYWREKTE